jgi:hypothetical protein
VKTKLGFCLALLAPLGAVAQMVDEPVCYSWEGGHKSAGSFSKCGPRWVIAERKAPVVLAPLAAPPTPNPVMVPMQSCPPVAVPHKRPIVKRKPKPVQC